MCFAVLISLQQCSDAIHICTTDLGGILMSCGCSKCNNPTLLVTVDHIACSPIANYKVSLALAL